MKNTKEEILKELQNLFSWAEFYSKNNQWDAYNKCDMQIFEYKRKHNLD